MRISDAATDKIANLLKIQGVLSENRLNLFSSYYLLSFHEILKDTNVYMQDKMNFLRILHSFI